MADFIAEEFYIDVSERTIGRVLKQEKISHKKVSTIEPKGSHF
jgi:transposase